MVEFTQKTFDTHIQNLENVRTFLGHLKRSEEVRAILHRPAVDLLITGVDFLITNLNLLKRGLRAL